MLAIPTAAPAPTAQAVLGLDSGSSRAFYDETVPRVYGYLLHRWGAGRPRWLSA